jgi:hypothetical protein
VVHHLVKHGLQSFPSKQRKKWAGERRWSPPSTAEVQNKWRHASTPTHTPSWETQFHWYFNISAIVFTFPSVPLTESKTRRTNNFVDPLFGPILPHFFRFKQQSGVQPSTTSWRNKEKRLQNLVSCSSQPRAKFAQFHEPQGLSFWSLWFISRSYRDLTPQSEWWKNQWRTTDWKGTEVVVAYLTRLLAVGYIGSGRKTWWYSS